VGLKSSPGEDRMSACADVKTDAPPGPRFRGSYAQRADILLFLSVVAVLDGNVRNKLCFNRLQTRRAYARPSVSGRCGSEGGATNQAEGFDFVPISGAERAIAAGTYPNWRSELGFAAAEGVWRATRRGRRFGAEEGR
jgi:hypothetical protein